jgi:hypothetical protein
VLKSPQRTAQIDVLLQLFPDARFIHIVRHPYEVFASTMRLWPTFCSYHSLQKPRWEQLPDGTPSLDEFVLDTFDLLYSRFSEHKALVAPHRFHEIRYEDLIGDPPGEMAKLYARLELGDFEAVRPVHESNVAALTDYRARREMPDASARAIIAQRWSVYLKQYGYEA